MAAARDVVPGRRVLQAQIVVGRDERIARDPALAADVVDEGVQRVVREHEVAQIGVGARAQRLRGSITSTPGPRMKNAACAKTARAVAIWLATSRSVVW